MTDAVDPTPAPTASSPPAPPAGASTPPAASTPAPAAATVPAPSPPTPAASAPASPSPPTPAPPLPAVTRPVPDPARSVPDPARPIPDSARFLADSTADLSTLPAHTPIELTRTPLLRFLLRLPLKKLTIWAAFLGLLVLLRDFFPLILMTFVLSYIASTVVEKIGSRFSARWIPITLFFTLVILGVVGFASILVPQIKSEAKKLQTEVAQQRGWNKWIDDKLRNALGPDSYNWANEAFGEEISHRDAPALPTPDRVVDSHAQHDPTPETSPLPLLSGIAPVHSPSLSAGLVGHISSDDRAKALELLRGVIGGAWKGVVYVFLTIIFSFMLVWGLPDFAGGLDRLKQSRLRDVYLEVGPSIGQFGRLLGRAFEAQTLIAACNTCITFAGMKILGIPGSFLLSVIVFTCSFIPVAGVWISTAPIALTGLLMPDGGPKVFVGVIIMVTVAHLIEAYILNPRIYGHHMKMNPLAVLVILIVAEHTVGIWGLVVAIPLATYVWRYVILGEDEAAPPRPRHPGRKASGRLGPPLSQRGVAAPSAPGAGPR